MQIHDHFSIAALLGNTALEFLGGAHAIYEEARKKGLLLPIEQHDWPDALGLSAQADGLRQAERKHCIQAVILFQATMEKIPVFLPDLGTGLTRTSEGRFAASWRNLISMNLDGAPREAALEEFEHYHAVIYKDCRNPVIHGRDDEDVGKVNAIRFPSVYEGLKAGWRAYDYLIAQALDGHLPSWGGACKTWNLPPDVQADAFPDLAVRASALMKWHSDGMRTAQGES